MLKRIASCFLGAGLTFGLAGSAAAEDVKKEASRSADELKSKARTAVYDVLDKQSVVLEFTAGNQDLSAEQRSKLESQISATKGESAIEKAYVAVWADKDLPASEAKSETAEEARKQSRELAANRADQVEKALKQIAEGLDVETYNMAERPNWFESTFNLDEAKIKQAMQNEEAADKAFTDHEDQKLASLGRIFAKKGGESKVVVVLETKKATIGE